MMWNLLLSNIGVDGDDLEKNKSILFQLLTTGVYTILL